MHPGLWCCHFRVQYENAENCAPRFSDVLCIKDHYNDKAIKDIFSTSLHISETCSEGMLVITYEIQPN